MIRDLGIVKPGSTLYVPFQTFDSNDPTASVTITGLATTDIEIYKDGGVTQRASDSGYALLDTDGIDFDGVTGIHGFSIDLSDNTTAGFYASGSQYWVVVASITVDAGTVNFIPVTFTIGYPDAILNTTIATLASQTSFTLTAGPADDDALNNCPVLVHDVASGVQMCIGYVSDYTGSTKTVTLGADPGIFTMAATDNVAVYPPAGVGAWRGAVLTTALETSADIADAVFDEALSGHTTAGTAGERLGRIPNAAAGASGGLPTVDGSNHVAGVQGTLNVNTTQISGSSTAADNAEVVFDTDFATNYNATRNAWATNVQDTVGTGNLPADANAISGDSTAADNLESAFDGTGYDVGGIDVSELNQIVDDLINGGRLDLLIDAIKAKTDSLTFTVAGNVDANTQYINDAAVTGDGNATPWDGA